MPCHGLAEGAPATGRAAYAVFLAVGLAALLALLVPASAEEYLDAGADNFLYVEVTAVSDIMNSGSRLPIEVRVTDKFGSPVADATVLIFVDHGSTSDRTVFTGQDGRARFTYTASSTEVVDQDIVVRAVAEGYSLSAGSETALTVLVLPPPTSKSEESAPALSVGVGAAVAVALIATEAGRLGVFNLFLFPLYSRLRREEVLDHFVRGQIYGYIQSHPGEHYNKMRDDLRITNGTLSHHLRTLEMQGFVKSKRDGIFRRFYPVEMSIPQEQGVRLSDLQIGLLERLKGTSDGVTQVELALLLGVSQQTISYNLRVLGRQGIIRAVKAGRQKRYYVLEGLDA